jgi:hypothetical protein
LDAKFDSTQFQIFLPDFEFGSQSYGHFYRITSELGFRMCDTDLNEKLGDATTMQTSWRMHNKVVARKERLKTSFATYLGPATQRINTRRLVGQTDECIGSVCCWIGGIGTAAQPNARSEVLQTKNTNPNQQQDATMINTISTRRLTNKNYDSKGYRTAEIVQLFWNFRWSLVHRQKVTMKHMEVPHGQPEI